MMRATFPTTFDHDCLKKKNSTTTNFQFQTHGLHVLVRFELGKKKNLCYITIVGVTQRTIRRPLQVTCLLCGNCASRYRIYAAMRF